MIAASLFATPSFAPDFDMAALPYAASTMHKTSTPSPSVIIPDINTDQLAANFSSDGVLLSVTPFQDYANYDMARQKCESEGRAYKAFNQAYVTQVEMEDCAAVLQTNRPYERPMVFVKLSQ